MKGGDRKPRRSLDHEILPVLAAPSGRFAPLSGLGPTIQNLADRRESLPAQTACVLPGTQNQASTDRQSDPPDARVAQPLVQLAKRINRRNTENLRWLAPQGLPVFLAQEMPIRPAADSAGAPTSDPQDGWRKSLVGRGANCK